jgi:ligand-binding sensor domain-containing protein
MRNIMILISLLISSSICSIAQTGDYFISDFSPEGNADAAANFDLVQRPDGIIAIANRGGILYFDGENWEMHPSGGTPLSLAVDTDGIYAGGAYGVGFQSFEDPGVFKKMHPDSIARNVFQVEVAGSEVIAIEDKHVHVFSASEKSRLYSVAFPQGYLKKIVVVGGKPLISTSKGNYRLQNGKLEYAEDVPLQELVASVAVEQYEWVIASSGKIYEVKGSKWREINIKKDEYEESLSGNGFLDAAKAGDKVAITTLNAGVVILNVNTHTVERLINYHNGLPDNEIYFISSDAGGGIWLGHEYGLSRIAPYLPVETFSNFPGLTGNLISAIHFRGNLYVGTSTGLFKLEKVKNFEEVVNYVKNVSTTTQTIEAEEAKPNGLFSFLRRRREKPREEEVTEITYEKKVSKELKSIKYLYKKVEGVRGKVEQLVSSEEELFVASLNGLYKIKNNTTETLSAEPVKLAWINNEEDFLIANTYSGNLLSYSKNNSGKWQKKYFFEGYQDVILDIYEDDRSRIWFASPDQFYFITYDRTDIYAGGEFPYENLYMDPTFITQNKKGQVTFNNQYNKWTYRETTGKVEKNEIPNELNSFIKGANGVWVNEKDQWKLLSMDCGNKWINALKDISYITADDNEQDIYVITALNKLYKIPLKAQQANPDNKYRVLLKSITDNGEKLDPEKRLRFIQRKSDLAFEFIRPEYTGLTDVEYQFRIRGMAEEWSDWTTDNNRIKLNYLPEGDYLLELRSKTALGDVVSMDPVFFQVVPPYWKRPWFYAFEFTLLGMLLLLTIHLNQNAPRYRLLNKLLAFLTLIMIIEFIQVSAESNIETDLSPIGGFFIQVAVAFIILPVEGFLRRLIIKDKKKLPMFLKLYKE